MEPNLKVPDGYDTVEGKRGNNNHWHHFYIFYSEEKQVLNCWVRASSATSTDLAFISIRDKYGKWKLLDKDFDRSESKEQRKKFEERFVNKLKKITDGNSR